MKLKYILLTILFPAMTILFASCFDDLNTTPLDPKLYTADKAYSTPESYMQGLAIVCSTWPLRTKRTSQCGNC